MTGIEVPLELAVLLSAGFAAAGAWAGQARARCHLDPPRDPLRDLMKPEVFAEAINLATRRNALRAGSRAVLHGRIDPFSASGGTWNSTTRDEVREHVAAVMRAGLRRDDRIALSGREGFTITISGADERAATRIANRLRRALAQLRLPQLGSEARLTASFGVAAERFGDGESGLDRRARQALDAALAKGSDQVVPASEIEDVILLPAPPDAAASAA
jgi:diguanylate cyclase (GGDEF)-like protein